MLSKLNTKILCLRCQGRGPAEGVSLSSFYISTDNQLQLASILTIQLASILTMQLVSIPTMQLASILTMQLQRVSILTMQL